MNNEIVLYYNGKIQRVEKEDFIYKLLKAKAITKSKISRKIYEFLLEDIDKTIGIQVYEDGEVRINLEHKHYKSSISKFCNILTNRNRYEELEEIFNLFES